jgi:DNA-binding MarR family transcriptional regulator
MNVNAMFVHASWWSYTQKAMSSTGPELIDEWRELLARHARVNAALERDLQRHHRLSVTELEALQRLEENDVDGCRLQKLVEDVHMSQSALSRLVSRLEDEGLVSRRSCAEDRRGTYACITDAGRARVREAEATQREVLARTLT